MLRRVSFTLLLRQTNCSTYTTKHTPTRDNNQTKNVRRYSTTAKHRLKYFAGELRDDTHNERDDPRGVYALPPRASRFY